MRTTVDLPPALHERARRLATERGTSMSAVLADLTARGLASLAVEPRFSQDERTGLPVLRLGRPVTDEDVAEALDDA